MRVGLADDAVVHVVQLAQSLRRQVALDRPVDPADRCHVRLLVPQAVLGHQLHGREQARHRTRGQHRAPDQQVRGGEVVQQPGMLVLVHRRDGDVDDALGALEGFFEGGFTEALAKETLQLADVHDRLLAQHLAGLQATPDVQVHVLAADQRVEFAVLVRAQERGDHRPGAGARDHARQQVLLAQGLDHAEVEHAHVRAAAEHQRRAAKALPGMAEKHQLLGIGQFGDVVVAQVVQQRGDLGDVVVDQQLGADVRVLVELGIGQVAQVAVQALAQAEDQLRPVAGLAPGAQVDQALLDQLVLVIARDRVVLPAVQAFQRVQHHRLRTPGAVVGRLIDQFLLCDGFPGFHGSPVCVLRAALPLAPCAIQTFSTRVAGGSCHLENY